MVKVSRGGGQIIQHLCTYGTITPSQQTSKQADRMQHIAIVGNTNLSIRSSRQMHHNLIIDGRIARLPNAVVSAQAHTSTLCILLFRQAGKLLMGRATSRRSPLVHPSYQSKQEPLARAIDILGIQILEAMPQLQRKGLAVKSGQVESPSVVPLVAPNLQPQREKPVSGGGGGGTAGTYVGW